jgi:O-antigen ligase
MSMAASLTLGVFAARFSSLLRRGLYGRSLFVHLGSTDGAKLILTAFGAFVMFAGVLLSQSRSGAMACLAGVMWMAFFAARPAKGHRSRLAAAAFACILLAAALWAGTAPLLARAEWSFGPDLSTRIRAWNDALRVARAFPLAGTGLNTYSDMMLLYQTADSETHYTAAHNDYLQLAAEGGLLVTIPVLFALLVFGREACARLSTDDPATRTYWIRRGAVAALGAIAAQSVFDFSLQIPANALLFAAMCALAVHEHPSRLRPDGHGAAPVVEFRLFRRREGVRTV